MPFWLNDVLGVVLFGATGYAVFFMYRRQHPNQASLRGKRTFDDDEA